MANDKLDNRNRLLQQMGLIYSQIMDLNEQMTEALQSAVDIDISVTGGVSDITKEFMEGFHYRIDEHSRVVSEQNKWEYDQLPPVKETRTAQVKQNENILKRTIMQEDLNRLIHEHREKLEAGNHETLDLSNCIFNNIEFTGELSDVNLTGSELNGCTFRNVEMRDSNFSNAEFMNTQFSDCKFNHTLLHGAEMGYCKMQNIIFTDCDIQKAAIVACEMESSRMNGCDLESAIVSDTKFINFTANDCWGTDHIDFSGIDKSLRSSAETIFHESERAVDPEIKPNNETAVHAYMGKQGQEPEVPAKPEAPQKEKSQKEKNKTAIPAKYVALVYVKGSDVKTRVTGTSPEKIIELCQNWNAERASDNQLGTAYIKKYNLETKSYENFGKYDINKGVALQPIYLELPPLGKEKFGQLVSEFKKNGAKYNPELKKWYVTQACDLSLFKQYLPKQPEPQIDAKGQQDGKKSVIGNLSQNKSHVDETQTKRNEPHGLHEQQRKEPER